MIFQARRRTYAYRNYLQQYLYTRRSNPPYFTTPKPKQEFEVPRARSTSKTTRRTTTTTTSKPVVISPANRLAKIIEKTGGKCGARFVNYILSLCVIRSLKLRAPIALAKPQEKLQPSLQNQWLYRASHIEMGKVIWL